MKTYQFTDPKGRTLQVDSPTDSPPSEQDLDQMFALKYGKDFDAVQNIVEHPIKSAFSPLSQTLTGKTLQERAIEKTTPTYIKPGDFGDYLSKVLSNAGAGIAGQLADIATTPASYIPLPLGKVVGSIPFRGTTVGKIAKKVPISQILNKDVKEIIRYQDALKNLPSSVSKSLKPLQDAGIDVDPITKITQALKEAGPIRSEQEALYTQERRRRAGILKNISETQEGEAGFISKLKSLKGEMPHATFEGIREKISQSDLDFAFSLINSNRALNEFEKVSAANGLRKLLGETGGLVPAQNELDLLGKVFPKEFIATVLEKRPTLEKFGEGIGQVLNLPRAMMSSFDLSAPLRQGVFLIGRPKQWVPAFGNMFKYFFNEDSYRGLLKDIKSRPTYELMKDARLSITDIGKKLYGREESFMSNLAEQIPLIGHGVRASNRAYSGFLNKLRADVFDDLIRIAKSQNIPIEGKVLKDIGSFVNAATGRANLPGQLERASVALNSIFFSPKLMASRLTLLNPAYYVSLSPMVRKEALKSLFTFATTAGTVIGLAKMGGANVGSDPRSADFGKIKVGNTRYDILGGFQQYIRLAAQMLSGEHISSTTGVKTTVGEGYKSLSRAGIIGRFIESKEAPIASFTTKMLRGKEYSGETFSVPKEIASRFTPMIVQDMIEVAKERGPSGTLMDIPALFGVGVQTYSPTAEETVYSSKAAINYARTLFRQGDFNSAQKILDDNKDLISQGTKLYQFQDRIQKWESIKERINKDKRLTIQQKNVQKSIYDHNIQTERDKMERIFQEMKAKGQ